MDAPLKAFPITEFPGISIGQVENVDAATGVTVILCPEGRCAG